MNISMIGLGSMGTALATAMLDKQMQVVVWNRSPEKATPLINKGALQAKSIGEAVDASSFIVICLLTYETVYETLGPCAQQLRNKVIVNLTNGTPQQARDMANWAAKHGAIYLDGGIMAVPPMIGTPDAMIIYSGSKEAFEKYRSQLDVFGTSKYVGEDAGLAPLHDISLLIGMYGMFTGSLQAMALIHSGKVEAKQFFLLLQLWLQAMLSQVEIMATEIDSGDYYEYVSSNLGMQAASYSNIIEACKEAGISTELLMPLHHLFERATKAGYGTANISSIVETIKNPAQIILVD